MKWFRKTCRRRDEVALLAADALDVGEKMAAESHLHTCPECQRYYSELRALSDSAKGWEVHYSGVEASPRLQSQWATAIRDANEPITPHPPLPILLWRELILPSRYVWTGLAAAWVAIAAINAQTPDAPIIEAENKPTRTLLQAWAEQNRVLVELTQSAEKLPSQPAIPPRPRSELEQKTEII